MNAIANTEEAPALKRDVVPSKYRAAYKQTGGTNGDFLAQLLQTIAKDGLLPLQAVMTENGIPAKKWGALNFGQQRMNLANVLRSRFLKGDDITVLGKQYNIRHMADDYNGAKLDKDKPATFTKFAESINIKGDERTLAIVVKTFFPPDTKAASEARKAEAADKKTARAEAAAQKKAATDAARAEKKAAADKVKAEKKAAADKVKTEKVAATAAAKAETKTIAAAEKAATPAKAGKSAAPKADAKVAAKPAK